MPAKAEKLFEAMTEFIAKDGKSIVAKVKSVYHFTILEKKGGIKN